MDGVMEKGLWYTLDHSQRLPQQPRAKPSERGAHALHAQLIHVGLCMRQGRTQHRPGREWQHRQRQAQPRQRAIGQQQHDRGHDQRHADAARQRCCPDPQGDGQRAVPGELAVAGGKDSNQDQHQHQGFGRRRDLLQQEPAQRERQPSDGGRDDRLRLPPSPAGCQRRTRDEQDPHKDRAARWIRAARPDSSQQHWQ